MNFLAAIPLIGDLFKTVDKTIDVVSEHVEDKDKKNEIIGGLQQSKQLVDKIMHLAELQTKTIPWIDGLHKMGRQILNLVTVIAVVVLLLCGKTITPEVALILGGPNMAYQIIKGKGKQ